MQQLLQQQLQQEAQQQQQLLPSLQQLCVGVLGRHVTELVQHLEGQLGWLPADVKAALLAVARYARLQ
jgi:phosphoglycerate-specific signal transduction histidine kinase